MSTMHRLLVVAAILLAFTTQAAKKPNILFIFMDDHCTQATSAYGSKLIDTPGLDRIAHEGMMFHKAYVCNSICGPSRAVIQTGKYNHINGFVRNGNYFDGSQQTFPKLLQKAGYQTAVVGKWHLGSTPQGFDYYDVLKGQGPYYNPPMITAGPDGNPVTKPHTGYTTHIITEKTLTWLKDQRDEDKPFMLMYQHKAPHRNWQPSPKYLNWLDDVKIPYPETFWDDYTGRSKASTYQKMTVKETLNPNDLKLNAPRNLTPEQKKAWDAAYGPKNEAFKKANLQGNDLIHWKFQRYVKDYLRCVKSVDDDIVRVLKYLDDAGLTEDTIVMYSSDQGWYLGEHGWFDKRWMYEESLVTPLMVRWPGVIKPGSQNHDIVSNLDFAETFLDMAGVSIPPDMQGESLVPLLKGKNPKDWRKSFYYHYYEGVKGGHNVPRHYGVTTGRHKLINFYEVGEWEMFDLKTDPNEMTSIYGDAKHAKVQKRLEKELTRLRKQYNVPDEDPTGTPNPNRKPRKKK